MPPTCSHELLQLDVSPHAAEAGFVRPPLAKRKAATTPSGRVTGSKHSTEDLVQSESLFPGPLVLPDDALAMDPKEPPQSLRSWIQEKMRNPVTKRRKTIYVAPAPRVALEFCSVVNLWTVPAPLKAPLKGGCNPPDAQHVRRYLEAFYHPLPVKILPDEVCFVPWTEGSKSTTTTAAANSERQPRYIGLQIANSVTRITTRPCPDKAYTRQLSLNDILDAALASLPDDAYALVMLTNHDLYEDDDDDFCCGRAYGSSRVAVVSSARYHPLLDEAAGVERDHMWPLSHCGAYVRRVCEEAKEASGSRTVSKRRKTSPPEKTASEVEGPVQAVIRAALAAPGPSHSPTGLWLSRVVRTVAHEVGHCFCLGHCSYYACVMQSTGSVAEDVRQPPYLCPVCLAKLTRAVLDVGKNADDVQFLIDRYTALVGFCNARKHVAMFAAYHCWLEERIRALTATIASSG